jgi:hypothetical protein
MTPMLIPARPGLGRASVATPSRRAGRARRASRVAASRRTTTPERAEKRASVSETPNAPVHEYFLGDRYGPVAAKVVVDDSCGVAHVAASPVSEGLAERRDDHGLSDGLP